MGITFYVLIGILVLSVISEIMTTSLTSIWFSIGAIFAIILNLFLHDTYVSIQFAVLFVISCLSLILLRPLAKSKLLGKTFKTNSDSLIGKSVFIREKVSNDFPGSVKIDDVIWTCYSEDGEHDVGEKVVITSISGNKIFIKGE